MKKFTQISEGACPSKLINAWKLKIDAKYYLITPAHVAVYRKNDKWLTSKFLKNLSHLNWCIPVNYLANFAHEDDIAWTLLSDSESDQNYLELSNDKILHPTNVDFFFRQPYNANGILVENSSFASINGVIYPSPESALLEALDIGFRGMSGALALKQGTPEVVGMFVGRGTALGLKVGAELPDFVETRYKTKEEMKNETAKFLKTAGESLRESKLFKGKESSSDLAFLFESKLEKLDHRLTEINNRLDYLLQNAIMKHDLANLLSIVALRRGLIISNQAILQHIVKSQSVEIKSFAKFSSEE